MNMTLAFVRVAALSTGLLTLSLMGCKSDQKSEKAPARESEPLVLYPPVNPLTVEETARISGSARVTAIDYDSRVVTLEDASGRTLVLVASDDVRRLNEVRPGDDVTVEYVVSLLAELRTPTPDETANPIRSVEVVGRGSRANDPAGKVARGARVVTTVAAVDQPSMLVTLRGPGGDTITVRGRNPDNVARLKVGDTIVITFTESLAVALEKNAG